MRSPRQTADASARIRAILDLAIRLGMVMWRAGAGAEEATEAMTAVTRAYGLRHIDADVSPSSIALTWTNTSTDESITRRHNLPVRATDYTRLTAAADLHGQIVARRIRLEDAGRRLSQIRTSRPPAPGWVRRLGWAVLGGGAAVLLGGGPLVVVVAFIAALLIDTALVALKRRHVPLLFCTFVGGTIGPLAAVLVRIVDPTASATLVVVSTVIVMLAGVTMLGGVEDILTANYLTGISRLTEAIVGTTGIAAGVIASSLLLDVLGAPVAISVTEARPEQTPYVALAAAVVMALGFALGTSTPWRAFWGVAVTAIIGEIIMVLCTRAGFDAIWSAVLAAIAVGAAASLLAPVTRTPTMPLIIAAIVPMLPGLLLFNGMMQLATSSVAGLFDVFGAAAVAAALSSGSICGHYLVRMVRGGAARLSKL